MRTYKEIKGYPAVDGWHTAPDGFKARISNGATIREGVKIGNGAIIDDGARVTQ